MGQINKHNAMLQLIRSGTMSISSQAGVLANRTVTQQDLNMCAASHTVSVHDPVTVGPIH